LNGAVVVDLADNSSGTVTININANVDSAAGPVATSFAGTGLNVTDAGTVAVNATGGTSANRVTHTTNGLVLDTNTTNLTLNASADYSGLSVGAVSSAAAVQELTITASGIASSVALSNYAAPTGLARLTATASGSGSSVTLGSGGGIIGADGTANAALSNISLTASGSGSMTVAGIESETTTVTSLAITTSDRGSSFTNSGTIDLGAITKGTITVGANTSFTGGTLSSSTAVGNNSGIIAELGLTVAADATFGGLTVTAATGGAAATSGLTKLTASFDQYATIGSPLVLGGTTAAAANVTMSGARNIRVDSDEISFAANTTGGTGAGTAVSNGAANGVTFTSIAQLLTGALNFSGVSGTVNADLTGGFATSSNITGGSNLLGDTLIAAAGADTISGGDGNDFLGGADGNNSILGGSGTDWIASGTGNDFLSGGDGDDFITGAGRTEVLTMVASPPNSTTTTFTINGASVVFATDSSATQAESATGIASAVNSAKIGVTAVAAGDSSTVTLTYAVWNGSNAAASVTTVSSAGVLGTAGANAGNDTLDGGNGNDTLFGGAGADSINAGAGTDVVQILTSTDSASPTFTDVLTAGTIAAGDKWTMFASSAVTVDVIVGLAAGDTLDLPGTLTAGTVDGTTGLLTTVADKYATTRGTWDYATGVFTYSATGADLLVLYDDDGNATTGGNVDAVVLVGTAGTGTTIATLPTIG
jgi:hypothetical protein